MSSPKFVDAQPGRAIAFVDHVAVTQNRNRCVDRAACHELSFAGPHIEMDTSQVEHFALVSQRPFVTPLKRISPVGHLAGPIVDVGAGVAAVG